MGFSLKYFFGFATGDSCIFSFPDFQDFFFFAPQFFYKTLPMEGCPQCGEKRRTSHVRDGDDVCRSCGCVLQERNICEEFSVRVFADDPASADRVHYSRPINTFEIEESLTQNEKEETEKEFLMNGRKDINRAMDRLFPDSRPSSVLHRARELFDRSFVYQRDQKLGKVDFCSCFEFSLSPFSPPNLFIFNCLFLNSIKIQPFFLT